MAEERVTLSLDDGVMTDRRQVVDEPAEVEETTDVVEETEKPTKKSGKKRYVDSASDYNGCWGYICRNYRGRSVLQKSKYPKLPF